jgi:hypothetical protein
MHFKRDRIIRKQIAINISSENCQPLPEERIRVLEAKAHEQLSLAKIVNREMDYSKIELFLLLSTSYQRAIFYNKIRQDLTALFRDEHAQKTFEKKWTHSLKSNVMAFFNRLAKEFFFADERDRIRNDLQSLYVDTIERLLTHEKLSRIEEKFLEPLLVEGAKLPARMEVAIGHQSHERLKKAAHNLSKMLAER